MPQVSQRRGRSGSASGFTLVEILIVVIILGILAAIVVPQFTSVSRTSREAVLRDELRFLRSQVAIYRTQHLDSSPGHPGGNSAAPATEGDFVAQMTQFTDPNGAISATGSAVYKYGPYLQKMPANPINGKDTILIIADGATFPATASDAYGWVYQAGTQTIHSDAVGADDKGVDYFAY